MTQKLKKKPMKGVEFYVKVAILLGFIIAVVVLAGCGIFNRTPSKAPEVVEVTTPVLVQPEAPDIIIRRYQPEVIPEWVSPSDPEASSCLKKDGEDQQRQNMNKEQRIRKTARTWAGVI